MPSSSIVPVLFATLAVNASGCSNAEVDSGPVGDFERNACNVTAAGDHLPCKVEREDVGTIVGSIQGNGDEMSLGEDEHLLGGDTSEETKRQLHAIDDHGTATTISRNGTTTD